MESIKGNSYTKVIDGDVIVRTITSDFIPLIEGGQDGYYNCTRVRITRKGGVLIDNVRVEANKLISKIQSNDWKIVK